MIDRTALLDDLKPLTAQLVDDLRTRSDEVDEVRVAVHDQYEAARESGRTDRSYEEWREDLLAQVAVGWVLASVFVRFCEDNGLYETPLLSGPGARRELAGDHRADWLANHPASGDRDWLLEVFTRYRRLPGMRELLGEHNPVWQFGPSDDGAGAIVRLWRKQKEDSAALTHDFTDPELDTRFLGDLYQDLSDHAKKSFALLQTPDFVEEFILDRTLNPAIETFGLAGTKMIDPTCGSGHFLLGAFERILRRWRQTEPGTPVRELVQRTLNAVNGVDLNPFAVAIARFRLMVAALKASEVKRLKDAPDFHFRVAVGDSLIHGTRSGELFGGAEGFSQLIEHRYPQEDGQLANEILQAGSYQAVVGNPPYITVKEPALRDAYRAIYPTCYMQYSLGVPFTERFWDLAIPALREAPAGCVGLITANSFMKRQFGKKLVEEWFPDRDLTHVIDTSGAYIPGHGTPTVILLGRHAVPSTNTIRAVLGIRGEPGSPRQPKEGKVWTSILRGVDRPGWENDFLSVDDAPRERFSTHPWSVQGGAAPTVKGVIERSPGTTIEGLHGRVGRMAASGEDAAFESGKAVWARDLNGAPAVLGDGVRDWRVAELPVQLWPYEESLALRQIADLDQRSNERLWPLRRRLQARKLFGKFVAETRGGWHAWNEVYEDKATGLRLVFPLVATHNHFVPAPDGVVLRHSAPVLRIPDDCGESGLMGLLGLLNSSTACFWMKQVFHNKGDSTDSKGARVSGVDAWVDSYEHDGTKLKLFPIPEAAPLDLARQLDTLAQQLSDTLPAAVLEREPPSAEVLDAARDRAEQLRARMVALQEELDWQVYQIYGLINDDLRAPGESVPPLKKGERAFEIVLALRMAAGEAESTWFARHESTPITELPTHWPEAYRRTVERRIALIESDRAIRLLERPEHKRRWNWDTWEDLEQNALRRWLLDRMESAEFWETAELQTTARLADHLRRDDAFMAGVRRYRGRSDIDLTEVVAELVADEAVPFAVGYRFKPSGLRRQKEWQKVWALQRKEDAIDARTELPEGDPNHLSAEQAKRLKAQEGLDRIPVPPKYRKSDYATDTAYKLRGRLDVPQERFISYPDTHIGSDTSLVIGWAGWDHLQRARALASHYATRRDEGASEAERIGLLAGLWELVPWLKQWHNDIDPDYGQRMGDFFESFVRSEAAAAGVSIDVLDTWTPSS